MMLRDTTRTKKCVSPFSLWAWGSWVGDPRPWGTDHGWGCATAANTNSRRGSPSFPETKRLKRSRKVMKQTRKTKLTMGRGLTNLSLSPLPPFHFFIYLSFSLSIYLSPLFFLTFPSISHSFLTFNLYLSLTISYSFFTVFHPLASTFSLSLSFLNFRFSLSPFLFFLFFSHRFFLRTGIVSFIVCELLQQRVDGGWKFSERLPVFGLVLQQDGQDLAGVELVAVERHLHLQSLHQPGQNSGLGGFLWDLRTKLNLKETISDVVSDFLRPWNFLDCSEFYTPATCTI